MKKILITGGAGFIGSNIARKLVAEGKSVTILDNFHPQIHGKLQKLPADLENEVTLVTGSVEDRALFFETLKGQEGVIHLAAETGTGQSMYDIARYTQVNIDGTAHLCDYIVNEQHTLRSVVVASSRSIYGEGKYISPEHGSVYPAARTRDSIKNTYEVLCPVSGQANLRLVATDETSKIHPSSFYGITKQVQEQMIILATRLRKINGFALRYQNVYGPGQSLKNPYTGILSIFSRLALKNEPINIFEDGLESRDFVFIEDVVNATILALEKNSQEQHILNVGSGIPTSVLEVARTITGHLNSQSEITISGSFREGDIRHNYADLQLLQQTLGFTPAWKFNKGIGMFLNWVLQQSDIPENMDDYRRSLQELAERNLLHKQ